MMQIGEDSTDALGIPNSGDFIVAGSHDALAVRADGRMHHPTRVFKWACYPMAVFGIPDRCRVVLARSNDPLPIWTECGKHGCLRVCFYRKRWFVSERVPNPRHPVPASSDQTCSVAVESRAIHPIGMTEGIEVG